MKMENVSNMTIVCHVFSNNSTNRLFLDAIRNQLRVTFLANFFFQGPAMAVVHLFVFRLSI